MATTLRTSIPSRNLTPSINLARHWKPRSLRHLRSAHRPGLKIMAGIPSRVRDPFVRSVRCLTVAQLDSMTSRRSTSRAARPSLSAARLWAGSSVRWPPCAPSSAAAASRGTPPRAQPRIRAPLRPRQLRGNDQSAPLQIGQHTCAARLRSLEALLALLIDPDYSGQSHPAAAFALANLTPPLLLHKGATGQAGSEISSVPGITYRDSGNFEAGARLNCARVCVGRRTSAGRRRGIVI